MERRSFLRGVFGGVTAGGLILQATPKEIEAFTAPLQPSQPLVIDRAIQHPLMRGMFLYNEDGEQVLQIQDAELHLRRGDLTTVHINGLPLFTSIHPEPYGGVSFRGLKR